MKTIQIALFLVTAFLLSNCVSVPPRQQMSMAGPAFGGPSAGFTGHARPDPRMGAQGPQAQRKFHGYATRTHVITLPDGRVLRLNDAELAEFQAKHGQPSSTGPDRFDNSAPVYIGVNGERLVPAGASVPTGPSKIDLDSLYHKDGAQGQQAVPTGRPAQPDQEMDQLPPDQAPAKPRYEA
ncbi:MAG TPA: hypothetical protein VGE62_02210 [Candidatus Paceibacterota bacterium]